MKKKLEFTQGNERKADSKATKHKLKKRSGAMNH